MIYYRAYLLVYQQNQQKLEGVGEQTTVVAAASVQVTSSEAASVAVPVAVAKTVASASTGSGPPELEADDVPQQGTATAAVPTVTTQIWTLLNDQLNYLEPDDHTYVQTHLGIRSPSDCIYIADLDDNEYHNLNKKLKLVQRIKLENFVSSLLQHDE